MRYLLGTLILLFGIWLVTGVTVIYPGERAVIQRFGRVLPDKPGPGLYVGWPWGIDRIDRVQVELLRPVTVGFTAEDTENPAPAGQLLTGDHNLVNVRLVVHYVVRADEVERYVIHADRVEGLVARVTETALVEWVAARTVDEVLLRGKTELPQFVAHQVRARLLPYRLGIEVRDARLTHLFPPTEVKNSFDEVTRAQTEIRTKKYGAEEESNRQLSEVDAEAFALKREAQGYASQALLAAAADAATFSRAAEQYQRLRQENPRYLEAQWFERLNPVLAQMKAEKRVQPLDHFLGGRNIEITQIPPLPAKK